MPPPEPLIVRTRKRRRTVALSVGPDGTLTVQAPLHVSLKWIKAFIESRAGWINKRRAEEEAGRAIRPLELASGSKIPYLGVDLVLDIAEGAYEAPRLRREQAGCGAFAESTPHLTSPSRGEEPDGSGPSRPSCEGVAFSIPPLPQEPPHPSPLEGEVRWGVGDARRNLQDTPLALRLTLAPGLSPETRQAEIRTELTLWYKKQARQVFQERLTFWAEAMGVKPGRFALSSPDRRWGSCSASNDIRLNWRLIMAEAALLDYVIVHELAHVPHKNHGPAFWRCVARAIPDCKERRKRLQNWKGENWLNIT